MPLPFNIILELYIPDDDDFVDPFCEFERRLHEERKEKRRTRCRYVPGGGAPPLGRVPTSASYTMRNNMPHGEVCAIVGLELPIAFISPVACRIRVLSSGPN